MEDDDIDRIEDLIQQVRSRLARTSKYVPETLSDSLDRLIKRVDRFHDEILDEAGISDDGDGDDADD